jgi:ankyrin repeat protein
MIASYNANTLTVRALLACPAVVSTAGVVNNHGSTALMLAVMRRHVETVEALLCCPAVVATMGVANNGFTVLMIAEQTGHARMVQLLRACTVRS